MKVRLHSASDAAMVQKVLLHRPEAFEALVLRYQKKACAIALAVGLRPDAVGDVVQEAFLRAFQNLPRLRTPESFGPWFLSIVRNVCRSTLKNTGRLSLSSTLDGRGRSYPDSLEASEFSSYIWRKVDGLPEGIREAIFLYYYEGESIKAVSKALGAAPSAIKKRLQRGRELLREPLWRELRDCLRDMLPSTREWKQGARRLTLTVMAALPASWAESAEATSTGALSGSASSAGGLAGGLFLMGGKKLALTGAAVLLLGAVGLAVMLRGDPRRDRHEDGRAQAATHGQEARTTTEGRLPPQKMATPESGKDLDHPSPGKAMQLSPSEREAIDAQIEELIAKMSGLDLGTVWRAANDLELLAKRSAYARQQLLQRLKSGWDAGKVRGGILELVVVLARINDQEIRSALLEMLYALEELKHVEIRYYSDGTPSGNLSWLRNMEGYDELSKWLERTFEQADSIAHLHLLGTLIKAFGQNRSDDHDVRSREHYMVVWDRLAHVCSPILEPEILEALMNIAGSDHTAWFRERAIWALTLTPNVDSTVADLVSALMYDEDPKVRLAAIKTIAFRTGPEAQEILMRLALGESGTDRIAAFETLVDMYNYTRRMGHPIDLDPWVYTLAEGIRMEPDARSRLALVESLHLPLEVLKEVFRLVEPGETDPRVRAVLLNFL